MTRTTTDNPLRLEYALVDENGQVPAPAQVEAKAYRYGRSSDSAELTATYDEDTGIAATTTVQIVDALGAGVYWVVFRAVDEESDARDERTLLVEIREPTNL